MVRIMVKVRARVRVMVSVRVKVRPRVRAEWANEESPKHPMTIYAWIYFKLKYIFDGIFSLVYFFQ